MLTTYYGLVRYDIGQAIQQKTHAKVAAGGDDQVLIFQHPNVYTLGRMGRLEDILIETDAIRRLNLEIRNTDRGGEVTYHGPGQLVVYPIIKLDRIELTPSAYVNSLKVSIAECLADYGIITNEKNMPTGVWVEDRKIAAIGVRISKKTTSHGLALNVTTDLSYFDHIVPCGMPGVHVTSMSLLLSNQVGVEDIIPVLSRRFGQNFGWMMEWSTLQALDSLSPPKGEISAQQ